MNRFCRLFLFCFLVCLPVQPVSKLTIVILEGEGAINNVRQRVAREPLVQVEDENRKPIAGAIVVFTLPGNGPGASFADGSSIQTLATDEKGLARARGLQANGAAGDYAIRVTASYQGLTASALINQRNAPAPVIKKPGMSAKMITLIAAGVGAGVVGAVLGLGNGGPAPPPPPPPPPPTVITAGGTRIGAP